MTAQSSTNRSARRCANNFRLEGPSIALDQRIHAFRPDIADLALAGQVFATHYARPESRRCIEPARSEEHTSELQSLMRISYAVFCLKVKKPNNRVIIQYYK